MHGIQCDMVEFQNCTSLVKYKYIPVHTGIYRYVLPKHSKLHLIMLHPPSYAYESQTFRPPRLGFPLPKFHSQVLTLYTLQLVGEIYKYIAVYTSTYQYIPVHTNI